MAHTEPTNSASQTFMRMSVDEAAKVPPGGARVGAVLVRDGHVLVAGHKGEMGGTIHAEEVVLAKADAASINVRGATAFVTLEPCANLKSKNRICCADRLADAGITTVYIGRYDRNHQIYRLGFKQLRQRGVTCRDFSENFHDEIDRLNSNFNGFFLRAVGLTDTVKFDYLQNGGVFEFSTDEGPEGKAWVTRWSISNVDAMQAIGGLPGTVALARHATDFEEIHDPSNLDFAGHFVRVAIGEIAVFKNADGYALCKVLAIEPERSYGGGPQVSVKIKYELRPTA